MIAQPTQATIATEDDYRGSGRIGFRYLVTLIHRRTDEERLLDVVIGEDTFSALMKAIRSICPGRQWEMWEALPCDVPF